MSSLVARLTALVQSGPGEIVLEKFAVLRSTVWAAFAAVLFVAQSAWGAISFVQVNVATSSVEQTTVAIEYESAQNVGDLNVVIVGWEDTTSNVSSITDTKGNTYTLAGGPTRVNGPASISIYYAKNIVAAATSLSARITTSCSQKPSSMTTCIGSSIPRWVEPRISR